MIRPRAYVHFAAAVLAVGVLASVDGAQHRQTFAPHELGNSDGPAPIVWPTPELLKRSFDIESAEERRLKVVVVGKGTRTAMVGGVCPRRLDARDRTHRPAADRA